MNALRQRTRSRDTASMPKAAAHSRAAAHHGRGIVKRAWPQPPRAMPSTPTRSPQLKDGCNALAVPQDEGWDSGSTQAAPGQAHGIDLEGDNRAGAAARTRACRRLRNRFSCLCGIQAGRARRTEAGAGTWYPMAVEWLVFKRPSSPSRNSV